MTDVGIALAASAIVLASVLAWCITALTYSPWRPPVPFPGSLADDSVPKGEQMSLDELIVEYLRRKKEVASLLRNNLELRAVVRAIRMDDSDEDYHEAWADTINPRRHWREAKPSGEPEATDP